MVAVKGIYQGGNTVKIDASAISIHEPYEVVVSFLQPAKNIEKDDDAEKEADLARRRAGFEQFMKYKGTLHRHIDYKKELAEYRDERYGRIN